MIHEILTQNARFEEGSNRSLLEACFLVAFPYMKAYRVTKPGSIECLLKEATICQESRSRQERPQETDDIA